MICAYCGKEAKGTKEHVISSGILGLFPECFATIDGERSIVHQGDPMVKDVCADCNNNRISYIDSYAKEFIEKYFLVKYKKDDTLSVEYDYTMIQKMCLKFAFNDLRARNKDVSFFDDEVKEFLLNEEKSSPLGNITILAGLAVNTSPAPDYMFGNMKLRWGSCFAASICCFVFSNCACTASILFGMPPSILSMRKMFPRASVPSST